MSSNSKLCHTVPCVFCYLRLCCPASASISGICCWSQCTAAKEARTLSHFLSTWMAAESMKTSFDMIALIPRFQCRVYSVYMCHSTIRQFENAFGIIQRYSSYSDYQMRYVRYCILTQNHTLHLLAPMLLSCLSVYSISARSGKDLTSPIFNIPPKQQAKTIVVVAVFIFLM